MAIWATGNIYVPLNPYQPADRIASIIEQAEIRLILFSTEKVEASAEFICTDDLKEISFDITASPDDNDTAYILFTSGSTGLPKGVPVSYGNVRSFLRNLEAMNYQLGPGSRFLQMFDLSFDLSIVSILSPFIFRGTLFSVPNNNIKYPTIYRLLEEYDIEFAILVPSVVAYLQPYFDEILLEKMKYMCLSGEAVPHALTMEWKKCCPNAEFQNLYGPTEATIYSVWYRMPENDIPSRNGIVSIGWPTLEIGTLLVDEENKILADGEKGELLLCGGQVIAGYLKNEEKNREAFVEINGKKYYRTGDICIRENELYFYLGRKDYQVKIRGFRVELSEIEHHIASFYENRRVVAMAAHDTTGNDVIVAAIEGGEDAVHELNEYLKTKMPFYMIPSEFRFINAFPLNNNGKINRKEINNIVLGHD
ncbi:D-alanine--D-alanyl carrier protein ligase [bioreactor metagenome]|uniref:D-alanine--D-alanyl carrier protein ligase n=1 Tax=bioreactor metagenome TaxID=1076179 RepID=A0A644XSH5_9ZZZZ